ncbi:MAG: hypothetical protein WA869_28505, partial [Alloacidobacterium sp.]
MTIGIFQRRVLRSYLQSRRLLQVRLMRTNPLAFVRTLQSVSETVTDPGNRAHASALQLRIWDQGMVEDFAPAFAFLNPNDSGSESGGWNVSAWTTPLAKTAEASHAPDGGETNQFSDARVGVGPREPAAARPPASGPRKDANDDPMGGLNFLRTIDPPLATAPGEVSPHAADTTQLDPVLTSRNEPDTHRVTLPSPPFVAPPRRDPVTAVERIQGAPAYP